MKISDEGEYTLLLEHEDGIFSTTTFAKILLNDEEIEKISPIIKTELPKEVQSSEGLPLDLSFMIDCKVPFDYVWMRDDELLVNSADFL